MLSHRICFALLAVIPALVVAQIPYSGPTEKYTVTGNNNIDAVLKGIFINNDKVGLLSL